MGLMAVAAIMGVFGLVGLLLAGVLGWFFGRELRGAAWSSIVLFWALGACICGAVVIITLIFGGLQALLNGALPGIFGSLVPYTILFAVSASMQADRSRSTD
jgi:hypothetical protein